MARFPAHIPAHDGTAADVTEIVDVEARVLPAAAAADESWPAWPALLAGTQFAWWELQASAWQQSLAWWTSVMQGQLPFAVAVDIAEAEAEHATNPLAASPLWMPAQEITRQALGIAVTQWNAWLTWNGRIAQLVDGPTR